jgi:hypothetical protein
MRTAIKDEVVASEADEHKIWFHEEDVEFEFPSNESEFGGSVTASKSDEAVPISNECEVKSKDVEDDRDESECECGGKNNKVLGEVVTNTKETENEEEHFDDRGNANLPGNLTFHGLPRDHLLHTICPLSLYSLPLDPDSEESTNWTTIRKGDTPCNLKKVCYVSNSFLVLLIHAVLTTD